MVEIIGGKRYDWRINKGVLYFKLKFPKYPVLIRRRGGLEIQVQKPDAGRQGKAPDIREIKLENIHEYRKVRFYTPRNKANYISAVTL